MKNKSKVASKVNKDEREFLSGKIRALEKRLRMAERENARLAKHIKQLHKDPNDDSDSEEVQDLKVCGNKGCKSVEFYHLITAHKQYITCKHCGNRNVERNLDANRK